MAEVSYIFPNDAADQVIAVGKAIKNTDDAVLQFTENSIKLITALKEGGISFEKLIAIEKQAETTTKGLDATKKEMQKTEAKITQLSKESQEQIIKRRVGEQQLTQAIKDKVKAEQGAEGSLVRMRAKLKELTTEYDKAGTRTKAAASEIDNLSREIGKAEAATNRHGRGVGGYADQLGGLPGPLGSAVSGLASMGKAMWALVANPVGKVIAAIAVSLALLYKAVKATDAGATAFAGVLKALGNVSDVLIDRVMSYYKMLLSIIALDFAGIKKNAKDAFDGITDAIGDAAKAGWDYEQQMDRIGDREAASLTRSARLRKEIEELTVASRDRNLGAKEQMRLADLAMKKAVELNSIEVGFKKESTANEVANLASKIQNDKLSDESKRALLEKWLMYDDLQLESAMKNDKAFAEFYNKNEDAIQSLQKLKAEDIDAGTKLLTDTKRLQTSLFTFKKELYDEDSRKKKEAIDKQNKIEKEQADFEKEIAKETKQRIEEEAKAEDEKQTKIVNEQLKIRELLIESAIKDRQRQYEQEIIIIKATSKNETEEKQKIFELNKRYIDEDIAETERLLENSDLSTEKQIELSNKLKDLQLVNNQIVADDKKEKAAGEKKSDEDKLKRQQELTELLFEIGKEAANAIFEFGNQKREQELSAIEKRKDAELSKENLTAEQKQKIEEKYAEQIAAIKTKQAKADKAQALFQIAINTAQAILKVTAQTGIAAAFVIPGIIVLGVIQAAVVAAKKIPEFEKGTKSAPHEFIAGEKGRELLKLNSGQLIMADKPTYFKGNEYKGATVYNNPETERIISQTKSNNFSFDTADLKNEMIAVRKAIQKKPVAIFDNEGSIKGYKSNNHRTTYINRLKYGG